MSYKDTLEIMRTKSHEGATVFQLEQFVESLLADTDMHPGQLQWLMDWAFILGNKKVDHSLNQGEAKTKVSITNTITAESYDVDCEKDCRCKVSLEAYRSMERHFVDHLVQGKIMVSRILAQPKVRQFGEKKYTRTWFSISEAVITNKSIGHHFFDQGAIRFFNSRIESQILYHCYFVTSEQFEDDPRKFSLRRISDDGRVDTIGDHGRFTSYSEALDHLASIAADKIRKQEIVG